MGIKNENAAYCARLAAKGRRIIAEAYDAHDIKASAKDMLADLRHMCDFEHLDFHDLLESSYQHYLAEKQGGEYA